MSDPTVVDRPEASRYVALVDGEQAGLVAYRLEAGVIIFDHTEVDPALEGEGIGSALAQYALDDARSRNLGVVPRCPFIRSWIERHPSYADLVLAES